MPELPEVETVCRSIKPYLEKQNVDVEFIDKTNSVLTKEQNDGDVDTFLNNKEVINISRKGKYLIFRTEAGYVVVHLGMSGQVFIDNSDKYKQDPHTYLVIKSSKGKVRFRDPRRFGVAFGVVNPNHKRLTKLGPDAQYISASELKTFAKSKKPIKVALLDQSLVAGIGNIYADEILFRCGIHPHTWPRDLSQQQIQSIAQATRDILADAIHAKGSTIQSYITGKGKKGGFQKLHKVYRKHNKPCSICQTAIEKIELGGRSTHFCPSCQKAII
jgi:formamidopyrimidine-DNA glycosylase